MKITDKEKRMITSGKMKAVIRSSNIKENIGEIAFEIDNIAYIIVDKKHWTLRRINAQRGKRDFGTTSSLHFKFMYEVIYGKYDGKSKDLFWLIVVKPNKKQSLLKVIYR